jgi:hypothetical protein
MTDQVEAMLRAMEGVARVASVMVDGDEASRIIARRAMRYIAEPDPDYGFLAGDYYDVDHATFLRMKKLLLRLERLLDFPCSTSLWVRVGGSVGLMTLAVQNGSVHRCYRFGQLRIETPPEMAECVRARGTIVAPLEHPTRTLTVLAPVFDSLGDVTAVIEFSALHPEAQALPPAWS